MKTLRNLFLNQLADMHDAEHRLTKALPKLIKATTCDQLREALQSHLRETEGHVRKVEQAFECFGEKVKSQKCKATAGILDEGDELVSEYKETPALNAAIICACQKVEHYEMATYGTLREWAKALGNQEAAAILDEILDEEKAADRKLNELARGKNRDALAEDDNAEGRNGGDTEENSAERSRPARRLVTR